MARLLEQCSSMMLEHHARSNAVRNATLRTYVDASQLEHSSHLQIARRGAERCDLSGIEKPTTSGGFVMSGWAESGGGRKSGPDDYRAALAEFWSLQQCGCHACLAKLGEEAQFYVLCPECGCKRCPKATNHVHSCSQSNDSGQFGSSYGEECPDACCDDYRACQCCDTAARASTGKGQDQK